MKNISEKFTFEIKKHTTDKSNLTCGQNLILK